MFSLLCAQPVAFVSWGRTLELSTAASLDLCDWLEVNHRGQTSRKESDGVTQMRKYALLLTWSAELHQLEQTTKMKVRKHDSRLS